MADYIAVIDTVLNKVTSSFKPLLRVKVHFCFWGFSSCFFLFPSKTEALRTAAAPTYTGIKGLGSVWPKLRNKFTNSSKNGLERGESDELTL